MIGYNFPFTHKHFKPVPFADPELPRVYIDTTYVTPSGSTIVVGDGGDFQAALNSANPGDIITLNAGSVYTGNFSLPVKSGSSYIYIRSSASLTTEGTRVTTGDLTGFPKIATANTAATIQAEAGAHHYRFINCDIKSGATATNGGLVCLGTGSETNANNFPHHIILDRCGVRGSSVNGGRRGVMFAGSHQAVIDSYVSDWKEVGADTQAIAGWTGLGPYKIVNNYLEGAGENVLFGGADAAIHNLTPSDIEIRNNLLFKPLTWKIDDPSYLGTHWTVKNSLELKHAKRVLVSDNIVENCWADAQTGYAVLFTVRNQSGTNPWATVSDVSFLRNTIRNSYNGINMLGQDTESGVPSDFAQRLCIQRNLIYDIDVNPFLLINGYQDINIDHNTILNSGDTMILSAAPCPRMRFTNNIVQHNQYGIKGDGQNSGTPSINTYLPNSVISKNVFATPVDQGWGPFYPAGNYFPDTLAEVGFVTLSGYADLRLTNISPYHNAATDGGDIGANMPTPV